MCLIEKGGSIGAHILSGNVFEPRALDELFPAWREMDEEERPPLDTEVTEDVVKVLTSSTGHITLPSIFMPKAIHNHGNYIISLGELCEWLGERAEDMDVEVLPGIAGDQVIFNDDGSVGGVRTGDFGIAKDGTRKDSFSPGIEIRAS